MKYVSLLLILLLLLSGCGEKQGEAALETMAETTDINQTEMTIPEETTLPLETTLPPETAVPTEPELLGALIDPQDSDFVRVTDYLPGVAVDLKYATTDNFTGQVIYEFEEVFLRCGTVKKLIAVSEELAQQGLSLKIWDGFRPVSAQFALWEVCPDDTYVANPNKGYSNHSRGFAVDLTLVDSGGRELEMPTGFDDFSSLANRDYSDCSEEAAKNARLLEEVMEKHGFQGYWGEWWHFNDTKKYDVETCFDPGVIARRHTVAQTSLLKAFSEPETIILQIPAGEPVTVLGYDEGFALAEYWGYRGYVSMDALKME